MTLHSTTESHSIRFSPAELTVGRKFRCRLNLVWPTLTDKIAAKQQSQRKNHTNVPKKVDLSIIDPILIRNYDQRDFRWLPATVNEKTGLISYRCKLNNGGVVKRYQDKIHLWSLSPPPPLTTYSSSFITGREFRIISFGTRSLWTTHWFSCFK